MIKTGGEGEADGGAEFGTLGSGTLQYACSGDNSDTEDAVRQMFTGLNDGLGGIEWGLK